MKNKLVNLFFMLVLLIFGILTIITIDYASELEQQIELKDSLIKDTEHRDSIYSARTKGYSETITKYISDCDFYINNKKISTAELLKMTNEAVAMNSALKDSIGHLKKLLEYHRSSGSIYKTYYDTSRDSLIIYRKIVELSKSRYGINYKVEKTKNGHFTFERPLTKVDSALLLYPHYKDKVKVDSMGNWWITTESKTKIPETERQRNKRKGRSN